MNQNELYHHGILGQKWGVRRYQNKDGSLTAAGKRKYGTKANFEKVMAAKKRAKKAATDDKIRYQQNQRTQAEIDKYNTKAQKSVDDYTGKTKSDKKLKKNLKKQQMLEEPEKTVQKKKSIEEMSDEEIAQAISRIRLENTLKDLQPKHVSKGKQIAGHMSDVAIPVVKEVTRDVATKYLKKTLTKALGLDDDTVDVVAQEASRLQREAQMAQNRRTIDMVDRHFGTGRYAANSNSNDNNQQNSNSNDSNQQNSNNRGSTNNTPTYSVASRNDVPRPSRASINVYSPTRDTRPAYADLLNNEEEYLREIRRRRN